MEFLDDDLNLLDIIEHGIPRCRYDRADYLNSMDNPTFFKRFRLTKGTVEHVLAQIEHLLEFKQDR